MKKYCILASLLILPLFVFSQTKFGNATKEELEMTSYENDTTAAAVVLKKSGRIRFIVGTHGGFQFEYTEEKKVKILKAEALESGSPYNVVDNKIDYYVRSRDAQEDIKTLSGTTYNLEGGKVVKTKLSKANIFDEDIDEKNRRRKFTMPAAKVGSVVEYKYMIVSDFYYSLKDFYFQENIPIAEVDLEVIIPEYFKYNLNNQGYVRMDESKQIPINEKFFIRLDGGASRGASGQVDCLATKYLFKVNNVSAARGERFIWAIDDYISKITFELRSTHFPWSYDKPVTSSWENIDKELMEASSFGGNLKQAGLFKKEIEKGEVSLDRATEISELIKNKMKWNEYNSIFSSKLKKSFEEGVGNNAEINFLLINALKAAGFDAFPVVLSTRGNGRIPIVHPSLSAFNYLITGLQIGEESYFIDAASKFSVWNLLPEKCMVDKARIIHNGRGKWVDLSTISSGTTFYQGTLKFEDGNSVFNVKEAYGGNSSYNKRRELANYESEEKYSQKIEENENCTVSDFTIKGNDDIHSRLEIEMVKTKETDLADFLYITPPITKLYTENPFKSESREFPVNFDHLLNHIQTVNIEIPEGYEVVEIPKSEQYIMPDNTVSYLYRIVQNGNKLTLNVRYQLKTLMVLPTEYEYIKDFFAKMISKNNEQIVLKKI